MLDLTSMERRDTPAALDGWAPEYAGPLYAEFGTNLRAVGAIDDAGRFVHIITAGAGGGPVVALVRDGGDRVDRVMVPGYESETYRGGLDATVDQRSGRVYLTPAGTGNGPVVTVVDLNGDVVGGPYLSVPDPQFRGSVQTRVGDLDGDGLAELVTIADTGTGRSRVCVLDAADGTVRESWYTPRVAAFAPGGFGVAVDVEPGRPLGFALEYPGRLLPFGAVETDVYRAGGTLSPLYAGR